MSSGSADVVAGVAGVEAYPDDCAEHGDESSVCMKAAGENTPGD